MGNKKGLRKCRNYSIKACMYLLLVGFLLLNLTSNYLLSLIRYIQVPPNVDCSNVLASNNDLEQKAYIEYLEQGDVDFTNLK